MLGILGAIGAIGGAIGSYASSRNNKRAAEIQAQAQGRAAELGLQGVREGLASQEATTREGLAQQRELFDKGMEAQGQYTQQSVDALTDYYNKAMEQYSPFQEAGQTALQQLESMRQGGTSDLFKLQQEETETAINRQAAKRGLFGSPASLKVQADAARRISAEEADRQFSREFQIANLGANFSQAAGSTSQQTGTGIANIFNQAGGRTLPAFQNLGNNISGSFNQLAQSQGRAGEVQGQLMGQGAIAQGQGASAGNVANAGFYNTLGGLFASLPNFQTPQAQVQPLQAGGNVAQSQNLLGGASASRGLFGGGF